MGLYDRRYDAPIDMVRSGYQDEAYIVRFVKETYKLFAASMLGGAVGAYVGIPVAGLVQSYFWGFVILEFVFLFALYAFKRQAGLNLLLLFAFVFMTGFTLAPMLARFLGMSGGATIIGNAFAMTSLVFGAMSLYAVKSTHDFTSYGKPLMIALIVVLIVSIVNLFLGSPILHLILSGVMVVLFSVLVIFDTQNIIQGNYETPIDGAVALYLDFLNIFTSLLQIMGIFGGDD